MITGLLESFHSLPTISNRVCLGQFAYPDPIIPAWDIQNVSLHNSTELLQKLKQEISKKICKSKPDISRKKILDTPVHQEHAKVLLTAFYKSNPFIKLLSGPEQLYRLHYHVQVYDRRLTSSLVANMNPNAREYEVDIAQIMLEKYKESDFEKFSKDFLEWRSKGLVYPLLLGMKYDTDLKEAFADWDFSKEFPLKILKKLDSYAVYMHVKASQDPSKPFEFLLHHHLAKFMQLSVEELQEQEKMHEHLPPSLLAQTSLKLCYDPKQGVLFFEKQKLQPLYLETMTNHGFTNQVQRLACFLATSLTVDTNAAAMPTTVSISTKNYPGDHTFLTLWKIDTPISPAIITSFDQVDEEGVKFPFERRKHLVNIKSKPSKCSLYSSNITQSKVSVDDVRQCLCDYVLGHHLQLSEHAYEDGTSNTNLLEALHFFTNYPPEANQLTITGLGKTLTWTNHSAIDARYAEYQDGNDQARFRDWVALYSNPNLTLQARLNVHCLKIDMLYHATLPWIGENKPRWVQVTATQESALKALPPILVARYLKQILIRYYIKPWNLNKKHFEYYPLNDQEIILVYLHEGLGNKLESIRIKTVENLASDCQEKTLLGNSI